MKAWQIVLIVILIVIVAFTLFIWIFAGFKFIKNLKKNKKHKPYKPFMDISFYENGPMKQLSKESLVYLDTLEKTDIEITAIDGIKLHGYFYKNPLKDTNRYFLGMHGFRSCAFNEYGPHMKYLFDLGFNVLIPDERGHFLSEGDYITMGAKEKYDTVSWAKYLVNKFGKDIDILIMGVSMGAASVTSASNLDLPKQVIGIISDCGYSSMKSEFLFQLKNSFKVPPFPIINILDGFLRMFVHVKMDDANSVDSLKETNIPILFVHGKLDKIVPVSETMKMYEACRSKKRLYIVDKANHAESIGYEKEKYYEVIKDFFNL